MARLNWITPAGNLGIVPETVYFEFPLDAVDLDGGDIIFSKISGILPPGIQVNTARDRLQGIPVSTDISDKNIEYRFTIRARNASDGSISDRTFSLTISNIVPPEITTKLIPENYLGLFLDGGELELQLEATESDPSASLTWTLKDGEIPPGLSLSEDGLISGYILPVPAIGPGSLPGWDLTAWDLLSWQFNLESVSKQFIFKVQVTDGVNYDLATYRLQVFPRSALTADNTTFTVDTDDLGSGVALTIDSGNKHKPIITTTQLDLPDIRQNSYFSFQFQAVDIDNDVVYWTTPLASIGAFDGQSLVGESTPYITGDVTSGNLSVSVNSLYANTLAHFEPGDTLQAVSPVDDEWHEYTVTSYASLDFVSTTNNIIGYVGNLIVQSATGANATISSISTTSTGNLYITGSAYEISVGDYITQSSSGANVTLANIYTTANLVTSGANTWTVGDVITQEDGSVFATVVANAASSSTVLISIGYGNFDLASGNIILNGDELVITPLELKTHGNTANVRVTYNELIDVTISSGNLAVNGSSINAYPTGSAITSESVIGLVYNTSSTFTLNRPISDVTIGGIDSNAYPVSVNSVGATEGSIVVQGTIGFDEGKFDQSDLGLPGTLGIVQDTGWVVGESPSITANEQEFNFELVAYKRDDPTYQDSHLFTLTVLGDINNRITWNTATDLGTIENGEISDLVVSAVSTKGKMLVYNLRTNGDGITERLPQGLKIDERGLIIGRVSFAVFSLDTGSTTVNDGDTTFDETYTFGVTATATDRSVLSTRVFTIRVISSNRKPYENLWLKALPSKQERESFTTLLQNQLIFPSSLIYRQSDPNFGVAKNIRFLFLPGLEPTTVANYANAIANNHFTKTLSLGEIKTARALDGNLQPKYEVVYIEVIDRESNATGKGPANQSKDLSRTIANPYLGSDGNSYTTIYTNAFDNMEADVLADIDYVNKGALPDWMTSRQEDGRVLGFTRAVVLAYTTAGASDLIAYRLRQEQFEFNQIEFTSDRYQLDNVYSQYYDIDTQSFLPSIVTTFDRYPGLSSVFTDTGYVDYALSKSFEEIHKKSIDYINNNGGLDGIKTWKDGELIAFAQQEYSIGGDVDEGWAKALTIWDDEPWDYDESLVDLINPLAWDAAEYVPGYNENLLDPEVDNQRIGIWQINIDSDEIVTLTFVSTISYYNKLFVKNGFTYGRVNIFYDPIIKSGNILPNYSIIPEEVKTVVESTRFDGNGTRFRNNRINYVVPEEGDKYIKFSKLGVFK